MKKNIYFLGILIAGQVIDFLPLCALHYTPRQLTNFDNALDQALYDSGASWHYFPGNDRALSARKALIKTFKNLPDTQKEEIIDGLREARVPCIELIADESYYVESDYESDSGPSSSEHDASDADSDSNQSILQKRQERNRIAALHSRQRKSELLSTLQGLLGKKGITITAKKEPRTQPPLTQLNGESYESFRQRKNRYCARRSRQRRLKFTEQLFDAFERLQQNDKMQIREQLVGAGISLPARLMITIPTEPQSDVDRWLSTVDLSRLTSHTERSSQPYTYSRDGRLPDSVYDHELAKQLQARVGETLPFDALPTQIAQHVAMYKVFHEQPAQTQADIIEALKAAGLQTARRRLAISAEALQERYERKRRLEKVRTSKKLGMNMATDSE